MATPNIANATSIYGKTHVVNLTTTQAIHLQCPANKVLKINSIIVGNKDGVNAADVTVLYYSVSLTLQASLAVNITVPAKSTLVVLSKDAAIYLTESDRIYARASVNNDLDMIISYEEIDDA